MAGLKVLGSISEAHRLKEWLEAHYPTARMVGDILPGQKRYFIDSQSGTVIFVSPMQAIDQPGCTDAVFSLNDLEGIALNADEGELNDYAIIAPIVGNGATERHIISLYSPPLNNPNVTRELQIYDSKTSNPSKLISRLPDSRLWNAWMAFAGAFRALLPNYRKTNIQPLNNQLVESDLKGADYYSLGSQSYFDGVKCGYNSIETIQAMVDLRHEGTPITRQSLKAELASVSTATTLFDVKQEKINLGSFLKQAWQDTFMPAVSKDNRKTRHFGHYFMGWPHKPGKARIAAYFLTLGFLFHPLINSLKIVTELPVKMLSETINWVRNRLMLWSPTNSFVQYFRGGLLGLSYILFGVVEGTRLLLRTIISPINSFKAGWHKHKALGIISAILSTVFIGAIAAAAGPLLLLAAPSVFTGAAATIATTLGMSSPVIASMVAGGIAVTGLTVLRGLQGLIRKCGSWISSRKGQEETDSSSIDKFGMTVDEDGFALVRSKGISLGSDQRSDYGSIDNSHEEGSALGAIEQFAMGQRTTGALSTKKGEQKELGERLPHSDIGVRN